MKRRIASHLHTLQLFPRWRNTTIFLPPTNPTVVPTKQKNNDFSAAYKAYNCFHAAEQQRFSCHLQTLQLFPRSKKTTVCLSLTNPTAVPAQLENQDVLATYKPYNWSHAIENTDSSAIYKPYTCSHAARKRIIIATNTQRLRNLNGQPGPEVGIGVAKTL